MSSADGELTPTGGERELTQLDIVTRALTSGNIQLEQDPNEVQREIVERILGAETFEQAMSEPTVWHGRDVLDRELRILGVRWWASQYAEGPAAFATMDVVETSTGEVAVVTSSAIRVMAKLLRAAIEGRFPLVGFLRQADRMTAQGYYPMWLEVTASAEPTVDHPDTSEPAEQPA